MREVVGIIGRKKQGMELTRAEIYSFVDGCVNGDIPDYQIASLLMAICLRGFSLEETIVYTEALVKSGRTLKWDDSARAVVDKHSTGGVGDKTSLVVVPLAVACGLAVAKLSGRGLGLTGGTIDKLESIKGLRVDLSADQIRAQVMSAGGVIAAQGPDLVPADGIIYSLRDVTGTIDSIPLIAASVMSKKIATGASCIAIDMKVGDGAFVKDIVAADDLSEAMIDIGRAFGCKVRVYFTNMNAPLGRAVGHSIEVSEALSVLDGGGPEDVRELAVMIVSGLLRDSGLIRQPRAARSSAELHLDNGDALRALDEIIKVQGGSLTHFSASPPHKSSLSDRYVASPATGYISRVDPIQIAFAIRQLGGSRLSKGSDINLAVGINEMVKVGEKVVVGDPLCRIYSASDNDSRSVEESLVGAFKISDRPGLAGQLIIDQRIS